ncbi:hypothetical protein CH063_06160 [Colletotrichum higginsianum]|nr:hypothetical protein CH063_06160 [Colletotrichum higginsianum]
MVTTRSTSAQGAGSGSIKRTRKQNGKSRQGCSQCKTRRIKCDENQPACTNCVKIGVQCPGFEQQLRWSNKHEQLSTVSFVEARRDRPGHCNAPPTEARMTEPEHISPTDQETNDPSSLDTALSSVLESGLLSLDARPDISLLVPTIRLPTAHDNAVAI